MFINSFPFVKIRSFLREDFDRSNSNLNIYRSETNKIDLKELHLLRVVKRGLWHCCRILAETRTQVSGFSGIFDTRSCKEIKVRFRIDSSQMLKAIHPFLKTFFCHKLKSSMHKMY